MGMVCCSTFCNNVIIYFILIFFITFCVANVDAKCNKDVLIVLLHFALIRCISTQNEIMLEEASLFHSFELD